MAGVCNAVGGDIRRSCLNLLLLKLKVSTSNTHISLISQPNENYMMSLESQASTYQLLVNGNTRTSTGNWSKFSLDRGTVSVNMQALCRSGFHKPVDSNYVIKMHMYFYTYMMT